jgi:uncharacterized protein (TIGR03437 family)
VTFGGTAPTGVVVVNSTTITATTPAGSAGAVTVTVTVNGQSGSLASGFTYTGTVAISFAQVASATPQSPTATVSVSYPGAQTAGDLNVVVVGWNDIAATVRSVQDSGGNNYILAIGPTSGTALRQSIYYAPRVVGGLNTVTVTFSQAAAFPDVRVLEYRGVTTLDVTAGASGSSAAANSGAATTTNANELVFGANTIATGNKTAGSGFTARIITSPDSDLAEDKIVTTAGSNSAKATLTVSGPWVMQMATFSAVSGPAPAVSRVMPSSKSTSSGTAVTIARKNSVPGPAVTSESTAATNVAVGNGTTIVAIAGTSGSTASNLLTDLFCTPKIMAAGSQATCELRVDSTSEPMQVQVTSSSEHVKAPSAVVTRANQTRLTFQVAADALAGGQLATITATAGTATAQETIQVQASSGPVLTVPSTQAGRLGKALRFTVSAVDPAGLPVQLTAVNAPVGASFDAASGLFEWTPSASQSGKYKVTFGATNSGRQSSSAEVTVNVGSGLPSLANSERLVCSPGSLASLNGSGFGEPGAALSDSSGNSMVLGGTQVKINGQSAPVLFASDARVSFLCPALEADTQLEAAVETEAGISESVTAPMQQVSPMMFSLDGSGENQGVISFAGTTELAMARNFLAAGHPAQPGDEILIWGSGFGTPTEVPAVEVKLGGVDAEVESVSAVAGHAGVYTIQARVPAGTDFGEAVPVQVQVTTPDGKQFRSNKLTLALEPVSQ